MVSLFAAFIFAQSGVTVNVDVVEPEITVAQQLQVDISVSTPRNSEAVIRESGKEQAFQSAVRRFSVPKFDFVETSRKIARTQTEIVETWTFRFAPNLPGESHVPALSIVSRPTVGSGQTITTTTEPIPVQVSTILPGEPLEAQLKPAVSGHRSWIWAYVSFIALVVIAAAAWAMFFFRNPTEEPDLAAEAFQQLQEALKGESRPETIRAALQNYEEATQPIRDSASIWVALDEARFVRDEQPVSAALRDQIRQALT